jgi:ABC-type multidrug transport system fused ATPase/permease subunit
MDSDGPSIGTTYRRRADAFFTAEKRLTIRERMVSRVRLAVFTIAVAMLVLGWKSGEGGLWYLGGGIVLGGFFAAVAYHEHVRRQIERNRLLRQINEQAIARLKRDWKGLPDTPVAVPPQHRAVAGDLDLFGHASLFHFLFSANTPIGFRLLRDWLLEPASPDAVQRRQEAVAELAPQLDLRQTLILEGRLLADRGRATERFVQWAEGAPWLAARPRLRWLFRAISAVPLLIPLLIACHVVSAEHGTMVILAMILLNAFCTALFGSRVHDIFSSVNLRRGEVARYLRIFELMLSMPESSAELRAVKREATSLGGGVLVRLRQLNRLALLAMIRHSALLAVFVYLPLQIVFLYDFHVLTLLEAWQARYGRFARGWFLALGKFEALASLATLAHDDPDWAMPAVNESAERFQAGSLGHPLLPNPTRVANDVSIGPAGSFLLVTGSNMSGKSTLLRAIGVNAVLAQAGAPVCAERLVMPPAVLATSMRIRDSLEDGVSFYMAELMRLKEIVDVARDARSRDNRMLLYLLDEILLGTNSRERHIAVVRVLEHLLRCGAIGAISTHDLELGTSEPLAGVCRCVHFCETLHDQHAERPMTFDYRLRPGIATTTNALKLLEIVGLGGPSPN